MQNALALALVLTFGAFGCSHRDRAAMLFTDDFKSGLNNWVVELEQPGRVAAQDGRMEIDVPAGCTVWFKHRIDGPVMIEFDATVISVGGPNDRVSDLNCFWMARDVRSPNDLFATNRSGKFSDYNLLKCYYVGLGGNGNTTTRFRRYIGDAQTRPLLPQHDLRDAPNLLTPNRPQRIQLVADGSDVRYFRDSVCLFSLTDDHPYRSGWFGLRTTHNHMAVKNFKVVRLGDAGRGNL